MLKRFRLHFTGFTMIELLLVLIILSVVAGLAIPNFSTTYSKVKLKKTADNIAFVMRYAQSRSIQKKIMHQLRFDATSLKYWIEQGGKESDEGGLDFRRVPTRYGKMYSVPDTIKAEFEHEEILFYPDGRIQKTEVTIEQKGQVIKLSTKEQRGFVHIYEGQM